MPGVVPSRLLLLLLLLLFRLPASGPAFMGMDSSDSDDEVKTVDISPETNWSPSDLPDVFKELVGLSSTDAWADKRFGPTITALLKRWSAPPSGFRPQRDFH